MGLLLLLTLLAWADARTDAATPAPDDPLRMCAALTNGTLCGPSDAAQPSWCARRNPYLVPRFLETTDATVLSDLLKYSHPVCDVDNCFMFTRFMGAEATNSALERRRLFIANVATQAPDTNQLMVLQAETLRPWDGWGPNFQAGTRWGDAALATIDAGASPSLVGASSIGNPLKWYKGEIDVSDMIRHFAQRFSVVIVRRPTHVDTAGAQRWLTAKYVSPTSDFVSLSSAENHQGSTTSDERGSTLDHTQPAGWWIWHGGRPVYASLSKHRFFEVYRLLFTPADQTEDNPAGTHIWEIDREPVSMDWAEQHCPSLDLATLQEKVFNSPECQKAVFPGSVAFLKSCPAGCRAKYAEYLSDRRCVKALYDKLNNIVDQPDSLFSRGLSNGQLLCQVGLLTPAERLQKRLSVSFLEHSYGCDGGACGVGDHHDSAKVFPSQDISGSAQCNGRNRTLVVLTTPDSVSTLEYTPPGDPRDGPADYTMKACHGEWQPDKKATCYPFPEDQGGSCFPPCFVRNMKADDGPPSDSGYLLSLKGRVRRIDVEKEVVANETQTCGSCHAGRGQSHDDALCVYRPKKLFEAPPGHTISDATLFSSQTAPFSSAGGGDQLTQQVWGVVALKDTQTNTSSFQGVELLRFGNMTRRDQDQTRACNPVGSLAGSSTIPVHSPPVTLAASFSWDSQHGDRYYESDITELVHTWQPRIDAVEKLIDSANCSCAIWDTACLVQEAAAAAARGGKNAPGGFDPSQLSGLASMKAFPEGQAHVIHASTEDRRLIVIYLHEVPRQCHAASETKF